SEISSSKSLPSSSAASHSTAPTTVPGFPPPPCFPSASNGRRNLENKSENFPRTSRPFPAAGPSRELPSPVPNREPPAQADPRRIVSIAQNHWTLESPRP